MDVMTIALVAVLAIVIAAVGYGLFQWRARAQAAARDKYYYLRCEGCQRRLRYQVRQVGHKGKCSNCGHAITFPPISQSIE